MLNYWWVTRPKRKLNSVPEVLATIVEIALDQEWEGQRNTHMSLESLLERDGLKRIGERRDQTGGGGRTYKAWIMSLGLLFTQESTGKTKLTLAGEAIMNGDNPVDVIKNQVMKYQFPSPFSISRGVNVSRRFRIHPFVFILKLLLDSRIEWLTQEELAKIVTVEAETDMSYEKVVSKILEHRNFGDTCLVAEFQVLYAPSKGGVNNDSTHLNDLANTLINWLEYTQLVKRDGSVVVILDAKRNEVVQIVNNPPPLIDRPEDHEKFQRRYGVDPKRRKDTRNLTDTTTVTSQIIAEQKIKRAFIGESLKQPISSITASLIDKIANQTGILEKNVEATLLKFYPHGSIGAFMTEYFEMAFRGRDDAIEFEKATVEIFENVFGLRAEHIGQQGRVPDAFVVSDKAGYVGIIDNKAYRSYSISNDHHNRMVTNYIGGLTNYYKGNQPLAFFSYIAGGFGRNIEAQLQQITKATKVSGSAMNVSSMIELVKTYKSCLKSHESIREIFSIGRQVNLSDILDVFPS
jgi:hypothetical protein